MTTTSRWSAVLRAVGRPLICLGLGVTVALVVIGYAKLVSSDLRWIFWLGAVGLSAAVAWIGWRRLMGAGGVVLASAPLLVFFALVVLPQLPGLWPFLVLWTAFALSGWLYSRSPGRGLATGLSALILLLAVSVWFSARYIPSAVAASLERLRNDPAPAIALKGLDGGPIAPAAMRGKVVVLDFFSTWCAPCIAELPELERLRRELGDRQDIELLIVADGSDTVEAVRAFRASKGLDLPFAYDENGKAHQAFGFRGLPALVVLDRNGRIRMTRLGYNKADTGFRERLKKLLQSL